MKFFLLLILQFIVSFSKAQTSVTIDTIFCDMKNTSYLVLNEDAILVDIGNVEDYVAQVKGNVVFIKSLKTIVQPTTILIKTVKEIYFGTLAVNGKNKKFLYDLKNDKTTTEPVPPVNKGQATIKSSDASGVIQIPDTSLKGKMSALIKLKNELSTLGFVSPTVDAAIGVIRNDRNNTFLKLVFKNKSSIPYKLDFISFQYYQDMKKGFLRRSKKTPIDVFPVGEPAIKEIAPGKTEHLPYVIPSYALANKGYLMVLIRESSGDRVLKIKVDGLTIQDAPQLIIPDGK